MDGADGKKLLQLTGRLSGKATVNDQAAGLPLGGTGDGAGAVVPIVAPLAPAAQVPPAATATATAVPGGAGCQVLLLQFRGGLTLDLLGLQVLLAALRLDILAVRGAGNLLGNLLCAVVNLLNGINLAGLLGNLGNVAQLLGSLSGALDGLVAAINDLLGGA
jgi:hypothetical protein